MVTFATDEEGAFSLEGPISGQMKDAKVRAYRMVLRSAMSNSAAQRAMNGKAAFEDATKLLVGSMLDSIMKKLEIQCLYGQSGYGVVFAATDIVVGPPLVDATITIADAEFAPGIWAGAVGMPIEIRNAALSSSRGTAVIKAVDLSAKKLTLVGALPAGTDATDVIFHKGAYGKEFAGIHAILSNTGVMFEIDTAQYDLWKGSTYAPSSTSVLSFAILQQAISKGVEKGLDSDVKAFINPSHWDDLLTEQASLRMLDSSYDKETFEKGSKNIKFYSQNGLVEIVPSIFVKQGYAYILASDDWSRVGVNEPTFKRPNGDGNYFLDLPGHDGFELRCNTEQAIFCVRPGRSILISNLKVS